MTTVSDPMVAAKVLIIEDDPNIVDLIRSNLVVRGFDTVVSAGSRVIDLFDLEQPDMVLLDLMLPEADGFELCRELRERSPVGIIVVSARGGEQDKVTALNMGADDYMTKPFGIEELLARIRATLRRTRPAESPAEPAPAKIAIDSLSINLVSKQVRLAGAEVRLTPTEFALLRELAVNRGKLLSRAHLLRQVWGHGYEAETEYIRVYISRLRAKLEPPGSKPLIVTRQRAGYLIPAEGRSAAGTGSADLAGRGRPPQAS
jgi:two-component system KDP operon response regulator KdpE